MSSTPPPPIRACLFDMDGLLIDSEDYYTVCTNEVLREFGKPDIPWSVKAQLQGRPAAEVYIFLGFLHIVYLYTKASRLPDFYFRFIVINDLISYGNVTCCDVVSCLH